MRKFAITGSAGMYGLGCYLSPWTPALSQPMSNVWRCALLQAFSLDLDVTNGTYQLPAWATWCLVSGLLSAG